MSQPPIVHRRRHLRLVNVTSEADPDEREWDVEFDDEPDPDDYGFGGMA